MDYVWLTIKEEAHLVAPLSAYRKSSLCAETHASNSQELELGTREKEGYSAIALRVMFNFFQAGTKTSRCGYLSARCVGHDQRTRVCRSKKKTGDEGVILLAPLNSSVFVATCGS